MPKLGRVAAVVAVLVLVVAGCGDDDDGAPPTTRRPTTTTDPFAVLDPIDVAYVERVMAALDHLYGDAAREVAQEQALTPRFEEIMRAIYGDEDTLDLTLDLWSTERERDLANLAAEPKDPTTNVQELLIVDKRCVLAAVERDLSPLLTHEASPPSQQEYVALRRSDSARDPHGLNPTGWAITFDGFKEDGSSPVEECSAS